MQLDSLSQYFNISQFTGYLVIFPTNKLMWTPKLLESQVTREKPNSLQEQELGLDRLQRSGSSALELIEVKVRYTIQHRFHSTNSALL